jgi:hypothetical protein
MFTYNNSFFIQRRFMFLPTTSALDIGRGNTALTNTNYFARYVGDAPPVAPFNTPFANFTTAFNENPVIYRATRNNGQTIVYEFTSNGDQEHEELRIRSANWLANEMAINNPPPQFTNCSAFCGNANVAGKASICVSENYNIDNNAVVNWTVSPAGIVTPPNPATGAVTTLNRITMAQ